MSPFRDHPLFAPAGPDACAALAERYPVEELGPEAPLARAGDPCTHL